MTADRMGRIPTVVLALAVPLIALVTVLVTLTVTSDDSGRASAGGPTEGDAITIANFRYSPDPLVVDVGTPVTVTNDDGTVHTVTADDDAFDTGDLDGGATATITVDRPGTFGYFCAIHNYMTGTIEAPMNERDVSTSTIVAVLTGALAIMVSGWVHFYLYFRGGYRGIAPESFLGITISRSFALNAIAAVVLAEALVLSLRYRAMLLPASALGAGFALLTLVAYVLSRTDGLLGFEETSTTTEAVVAMVAEVVAVVGLAPVAFSELRARRHPARR